ncbi:hypothetical protein PRZ48_003196 [Zasmidium cellare]|uniref:Uncharacterized protein n=1 Tax=Zasmidium cellare TaxID=395010 RepID=A0ABR0EVN8_ZASCE|nr:hypothetical protein PRZ48_003196 [Zasmidium cellare]
MFSTKSIKSDSSSIMSTSTTSSLIKDKFTVNATALKSKDSRSPREKQLERMKDRPTTETLATMALMK